MDFGFCVTFTSRRHSGQHIVITVRCNNWHYPRRIGYRARVHTPSSSVLFLRARIYVPESFSSCVKVIWFPKDPRSVMYFNRCSFCPFIHQILQLQWLSIDTVHSETKYIYGSQYTSLSSFVLSSEHCGVYSNTLFLLDGLLVLYKLWSICIFQTNHDLRLLYELARRSRRFDIFPNAQMNGITK